MSRSTWNSVSPEVAVEQTRNVAILIFDDVEVLDFCGPLEVFSVTGRQRQPAPFNVYTVAETSGPVLARNQLSVNPSHTIAECPPPHILVVPGGWGTRREMNNPRLVDWIKTVASTAEIVLSVCTGSLLLAKAGLLDGLKATTHHGALDLLQQVAPTATVLRDQRFLDNGRIIVSAGVSAGIDAAFHLVARLLGKEDALETARYIEYHWRDEPG
jgi:transcriptional regulator GlxA family with amidase domain